MYRTGFIGTLALALGFTGFAQDTAPAGTDAVYACATMTEDAARLACYDEAVGRLKAAEESGEVTTLTEAERVAVVRDAFGFTMPSLPKLSMPRFGRSQADAEAGRDKNNRLERVTVAVTGVKTSKHRGLTVSLENGQIWQQSDTRSVYYSSKKGAKQAEIRRAAMGSFMMKLDDGAAFRVKRLK